MTKEQQNGLQAWFEALRAKSGNDLPQGMTYEQGKEMLEAFLRDAGEESPFGVQREEALRLLKATLPSTKEAASPQARKKQRIVEAAAELFATTGFRKTSIDDIARRANVAKGTVYLHFESKAALLMQAIVKEKMRYAAKASKLLQGGLSPADTLRAWLRVFFGGLEEMPIVSRLMSGDREVMLALEELGGELGMDVAGIQTDLLAQMIDQAAAPHRHSTEEIRDRAQVLMALLYTGNQIFDERLRGGIPRERFAGLLADLIVDGLVGPKEVVR